MMKRILLTLLLSLTLLPQLHAQTLDTLGNQWYKNLLALNPNRPFVKLMTWREGVYRIPATDLTQAATGYDLSQVDARTLQLYYRGKRVPMYVFPENSPTFTYLEFLGKQNDGWLDSLLYFESFTGLPPANGQDFRTTKFVNLFSDTSAFFLTWESSFTGTNAGTRYTNYVTGNTSGFTPITNFPYEGAYFPGLSRLDRLADVRFSKTYSTAGGSAFSQQYTLNTDYTFGEGWVGAAYGSSGGGLNTAANIDIRTRHAVPGSASTFKTRILGRSETPHKTRITMGNSIIFEDTLSQTSKVIIKEYSIPLNLSLGDSMKVKYESVLVQPDNNNICWASILYLRDATKGMESFARWRIPQLNTPIGQSYVLNLPQVRGSQLCVAYDEANNYRIQGTLSGASNLAKNLTIAFPNFISTATRDVVFSSDSGFFKPKIEKCYLNKLHEEPAAPHQLMLITHRNFKQFAEAYKTYRDTNTVNQVPTVIYYTDEIYDEYSYGSYSPFGIKRFCREIFSKWQNKPSYVFVAGRCRPDPANGFFDEVPIMAEPVSDWEFVSHYNALLPKLDLYVRAGIGRLTIASNQEGLSYLKKVNEFEHSPWDPTWMKRGVFLGGGTDVGEVTIIENTMKYDVKVFEGYPFGGNAYRYQKKSNAPVESNPPYDPYINQGAGWIHFFGHSATQIVDVNLKTPDLYANYGKYPMILAMGCYVGNYSSATSLGQRWMLQPDRGAIGFIGTTSAGFSGPLSHYSRIAHNYYFNYMMGERIGDIMKSYHNKYIDSISSSGTIVDIETRNHIRQLNLQGDPSIRLHVPPGIDLEINNTSVYFEPENLNALLDSFRVNIIMRNLGRVSKDSFEVQVRQQLPNSTWHTHPIKKTQLLVYQDTLSFYIKNPIGKEMAGLNNFEIKIDMNESITEYNENNNTVVINKLIPGNIPACLFPIEFSVIRDAQPTLKASGYSMVKDSVVRYVFEMDTTYDFSSPFIQQSPVVVGKSMLGEWKIPVSLPDSAVVYWRVRLADVTPVTWASSTFRYIKNREGWAQARIPQFTKDSKSQINNNIIQNQWEFEEFKKKYTFLLDIAGGRNFTVSINDGAVLQSSNFSLAAGVAYMIIDKKTLLNKVYSNAFGEYSIGYAFAPSGTGQQGTLYQLIDAVNAANPGDYFCFISNKTMSLNFWDASIFDKLESFGVSPLLRLSPTDQSFIIFGQKGNPSSVQTILSPPSPSSTNYLLDMMLSAPLDKGNIKSTQIGPAKSWSRLIWNWFTLDPQKKEVVNVEVIGVKADGTETSLFTTNGPGTYNLDTISSATYPFMYLRAEKEDEFYQTAPQLNHWHVLYEQVPDAVVFPFGNVYFNKEVLSEGENLEMKIFAVNPSKQNMDSLLVNFRIEKEDRSIAYSVYKRFAPLPAEGKIPIVFTVPTLGLNLTGTNKAIVLLNPLKDQIEQYYFNNEYAQNFMVNGDKLNPLMHITFDGKEIMDMDIVSPTPEILIQLKDENPYLALDDTAGFRLELQNPNSSAWEPIYMSDPRIRFEPGTLSKNKAKVYFYPGKLTPMNDSGDDHYKLRVQGADRRGNLAGNANNANSNATYPGNGNYEIAFRVVNAHTISNVLNYPNPFSTSTRFVYVLTGSELPEVFKIQIFTVSGKLVKTIDLVELGDVHFGKNVTEYAWDGTDEYGDKLANGVYMYRVLMRTKINKLDASSEDDKTDKFFKGGWGKMYIMR